MMKKSSSFHLGFTLIELLVVISIIAILFNIGMAAYTQFNRGQILFQAAKTLKNDLRLVQSKTLSGEKDPVVCTGKTLEGWYFAFTASSYNFYGSCGGSQFGQKTINLPTNVSLSTNPSSSTLQFNPMAGGVSQAMTITLSAFGKSQLVTVSTSGDIN